MNVLVVDTSSWISYFAGRELPELDLALREGRVLLPPIVAAELMSGQMGSKQRHLLVEMLAELPLCDGSLAHWVRAGELRARFARLGVQVSTPDAHIAQCSLDLDGYLLTEDKVFRVIAKHAALRLAT